MRCTEFYCDYAEKDNFTDPIVPALAIPTAGPEPAPSSSDAEAADSLYGAMRHSTANGAPATPAASAAAAKELDISDDAIPIPNIRTEDLPHCPKCKTGLLRPGVVWFGEMLPSDTVEAINAYMQAAPRIDLMLVIGTSAVVYPAAGYVERARRKGARVAVVNVDRGSGVGLVEGDWFFQGDAGVLVPEILRAVVGEVGGEGG